MNITVADVPRIQQELAAFFEAGEVKFKPQSTSKDGSKALAIPFVDVRAVTDRLDRVLGVNNWRDSYQTLGGGAVLCRLEVKFDGEWIAKEDVGGQSEQPDEGDRTKAAFSDALKRAAVKFGVGRYLYNKSIQKWVPFDSQKKRFTEQPRMPPEFLPQPEARDGGARSRAASSNQPTPQSEQPAQQLPRKALSPHDGVLAYDAKLAKEGVSDGGALVAYVAEKLGDDWASAGRDELHDVCGEFATLMRDARELVQPRNS